VQSEVAIREEFEGLSTLQAEHLIALNGGPWIAGHAFLRLDLAA
jgi:hypothetical protein